MLLSPLLRNPDISIAIFITNPTLDYDNVTALRLRSYVVKPSVEEP
jgi:hypothetical protein